MAPRKPSAFVQKPVVVEEISTPNSFFIRFADPSVIKPEIDSDRSLDLQPVFKEAPQQQPKQSRISRKKDQITNQSSKKSWKASKIIIEFTLDEIPKINKGKGVVPAKKNSGGASSSVKIVDSPKPRRGRPPAGASKNA